MGEKKRRLAANQASSNAPAVPPTTLLSDAGHAAQLLQQGLQAHQQGQFAQAITRYQQARTALAGQSGPELAQVEHYLGLAMTQIGSAQQGIVLMQQALQHPQLEPKLMAQMHFNLARAMQEMPAALGLQQEIRAHVAQASRLASNDIDYALAYAQALFVAKEIQPAIAHLQALHANGVANSTSLDLLAQYLYQDNQLAAAKASFSEALARKPELRRERTIDFSLPAAQALHLQQSPQQICYQPGMALAPEMENQPAAFADQAQYQAWLAELDLHVIDNFLPNFSEHRASVLALPLHAMRYAGQNYPGQQSDGQDCPAIMAEIARILGKTIKFASPDNGSVRLSLANAVAKSDIHADNESGDSFALYAAVLYLNLPEHCQGGTSFWRHQPTAWSRRQVQPELSAQGYASFKQFQQRHLPHNIGMQEFNQLAERRQEWQSVLEVSMRSNRLIIYRGDFFHSIGTVFGNNAQDGRLVQLFFFETLNESVA